MEQEGLNAVCASALKKLSFMAESKARYFVYACLAGAYCAIGMALSYSVSAGFYYSDALRGAYRFMMGATFTLSFTMIIFAGAELFTGNVLTLSVALLLKRARLSRCLSLLGFCYLANVAGAVFMGLMVSQTGILEGQTGELLLSSATAKASFSVAHAFFRGIMCNILVCLGIWCVAKLKSESAKLIVLFWAVVGFVAPGYEHSIANAAIFTMALSVNQAGFNMTGILLNMLFVTLGNLLGGAVFVGLAYAFAGSGKE